MQHVIMRIEVTENTTHGHRTSLFKPLMYVPFPMLLTAGAVMSCINEVFGIVEVLNLIENHD
jgi:hypothetical protein